MALFGGNRDAQFVKRVNLELINRIIDTEIDYYKISLEDTEVNMYDESTRKTYYAPIRVPSLISRLDPTYSAEEIGDTYTQFADFSFIRDWLLDLNLVPEVGDLIAWDTDFYEVDELIENQYFAGKKPETAATGPDHGLSLAITLKCHKTRVSKVHTEDTRAGINRYQDNAGDVEYI
jgi:hypothetical protein